MRSALTSIKGAIFIYGDKDVGQGAGAARACAIQLDQLQAWCGLRWETVELEGEIHSLWPRCSWAVLGCSEHERELINIHRGAPGGDTHRDRAATAATTAASVSIKNSFVPSGDRTVAISDAVASRPEVLLPAAWASENWVHMGQVLISPEDRTKQDFWHLQRRVPARIR